MMKKVLFLFLFIPVMLLVITACEPEDGEDGALGPQGMPGPQGDQGDQGPQGEEGITPVVEVFAIMVGNEPCPEDGGNTVVITTGTNVQMIDICNPADGIDGEQGPQGETGTDGMDSEPITTTMTDASLAECPFGGDVVTIFQGGVQVGSPVIICDGEDGTNIELTCGDLTDNDGDSLVDCADPDCAGQLSVDPNAPLEILACQSAEANCTDNFDNDGDGLIDTDDSDCVGVVPGSIDCGFISPNLFVDFFIFDVNSCTCDITTLDSDGTSVIENINGIDASIFFSFASCEAIPDSTLTIPTSFDVTINCENTVTGVMADPEVVTGCSAQ